MNETTGRCPVEITLSLMSNKWKALILRDLLTGTKRFSELKRSLHPITQKMLTQNLRELEANGLISRTVYPVVPPHVEYAFTDLGYILHPVIEQMREFGLKYASIRENETENKESDAV